MSTHILISECLCKGFAWLTSIPNIFVTLVRCFKMSSMRLQERQSVAQAIKGGHWVLLDELNLANQGVLEGLNAILDHRQEVFIPELSMTIRCPPSFRLFAAQNPIHEGGGRKGLPQSFLNRFSRVLVDLLNGPDLLQISTTLHPTIPPECLSRMVTFVASLHR